MSSPSPSITCSSEIAPRVAIESTWVWPLVNNPEPWVLGRTPTSEERCLISVSFLSSGLLSSSIMPRLISLTSISSIAAEISFACSSIRSSKCSLIASLAFSVFASLTTLSFSLIALTSKSWPNSFTLATISSSALNTSYSALSLPISLAISSTKSQISLIISWPSSIASSISASLTSWAPASTIIMAVFVPARDKFILELFLCSSFGLIIYFPSMYPTSTEPVGPSKGISEIERAIEEPIIATISGEWSWSTLKTVATMCTSFL